MTDLNELRERVHRVSGWPPVDPDGAELTRRSATRRTRRNRIAVIGGGAAVLGAIAIAPITLGGMFDNDRDVPPANAPTGQGSLGVAAGFRPVGALGLVFEIPQGWSTNEVACDGSPTGDTVAFGFGRLCEVPNPPKVSSLLITTEDNHLVTGILTNMQMASVRIGGANLKASDPAQIDGLWTFAVADSTGDVVVVRTQDEAVARHTRQALRAIPSGYVTIPLMPGLGVEAVRTRLSELGLSPVVKNVPANGRAVGDVVGTSPPVASVIQVGQDVEVLRASDGS